MIKFEFKFEGKPLDARNLGDSIRKAGLELVALHSREKIGAIRDPETGAEKKGQVHLLRNKLKNEGQSRLFYAASGSKT